MAPGSLLIVISFQYLCLSGLQAKVRLLEKDLRMIEQEVYSLRGKVK